MEHSPDQTITLITGATGFVGRHLVAALAGHLEGLPPARPRRPRRIHAVCGTTDSRFDGVDPAAVTAHRVDLTDGLAVQALMETVRPHELFHLAWFNGESADRDADPANFDWVAASENLVEAFARAGGRRAITAGSHREYGSGGGVLAEHELADPDTVYGRCKLDAGFRALTLSAEYDHLSVAVARLFSVLGRFRDPDRWVSTIIEPVLGGQPAELALRGPRRDYLHAWDVALGLIALAESDLTGFVNIGRGRSADAEEVALTIGHALGRPDLLWFGSRSERSGGADEFTADVTRITRATGWQPLLDLPAAADDVVRWWSSELGMPVAT